MADAWVAIGMALYCKMYAWLYNMRCSLLVNICLSFKRVNIMRYVLMILESGWSARTMPQSSIFKQHLYFYASIFLEGCVPKITVFEPFKYSTCVPVTYAV